MTQSPCAESCLSQVPQSRFGRVGSWKQNGHLWGTEMRPSSPMAKGKSLGGHHPQGSLAFWDILGRQRGWHIPNCRKGSVLARQAEGHGECEGTEEDEEAEGSWTYICRA